MGAMVALAAILGFGLRINRMAKWSFESSLLFVCASSICLLYFFGLAGGLQIAAQALLGIGLLLFVEGLYSRFRSGTLAQTVSPGIIFFVLSSIGLWVLTRTQYYSNFIFVDDFSHWGRVSKIIADNDRLIIPADPVWFQDYTPGMALFDYLFLQFSKFTEGQAMFAHGVFILAAVAQLFSAIPKSAGKYVFFGVSIFIYALIYFFGLGFHTLSVDLILGVVFGVAMFGYLEDRKNSQLAALIRLIPVVLALPLIKQIGILFSLVIVGVVVGDILLGQTGRREKIKLIFAAALMSGACFFTYVSWGVHIKNLGVQKSFNADIPVGDVIKAFNSETATERQKTTIDNFVHRVFFPHPEERINRPYYWFALCVLFLWFIWHMGKEYKTWTRLAPFAVLLGGFVAYLSVLLVLYLFSFSPYDGLRLASLDRYASSFLVGTLIVLFGVALSQYFKGGRDRAASIALVAICFLVMTPILKDEFPYMGRTISGELLGQQERDTEEVSKYWKVVESKTPPNARLYFVWQGSNGTENTMFNYGVTPRESNRGCWSVGEPYADGDVWTCRMTSNEFERVLMDYDYLLLAHIDRSFTDDFLRLLGPDDAHDGELFQVTKEAGHIRLRRV